MEKAKTIVENASNALDATADELEKQKSMLEALTIVNLDGMGEAQMIRITALTIYKLLPLPLW